MDLINTQNHLTEVFSALVDHVDVMVTDDAGAKHRVCSNNLEQKVSLLAKNEELRISISTTYKGVLYEVKGATRPINFKNFVKGQGSYSANALKLDLAYKVFNIG